MNTNIQVPNSVLFKQQYKDLVQKIVLIRKEISHTQNDMAKWLGIERRRLIKFEKSEKYDIELLLLICEKFSIEVSLNFSAY